MQIFAYSLGIFRYYCWPFLNLSSPIPTTLGIPLPISGTPRSCDGGEPWPGLAGFPREKSPRMVKAPELLNAILDWRASRANSLNTHLWRLYPAFSPDRETRIPMHRSHE